jgi:hypothetical protein
VTPPPDINNADPRHIKMNLNGLEDSLRPAPMATLAAGLEE